MGGIRRRKWRGGRRHSVHIAPPRMFRIMEGMNRMVNPGLHVQRVIKRGSDAEGGMSIELEVHGQTA